MTRKSEKVMLNIVVINCDGKYMEYEWDSIESFIKNMESNNKNTPTLDDVLAEVNTDDNGLHSWWRDSDGMTVNALVNECKRRLFNNKELELVEYIESAESYVSENNKLEMDFYNGGWYAHEYNGDESRPLYDYSTEPLITEKEIEKENVDVYAVFNYCHVAYCG